MAGTAINIRKLNALLEEFRLLTNVRISFWNAAGQRCASSGPDDDSRFCAMLRRNPELDEACRVCDAEGIRSARETGRLCVFTCHAGLHEYVYPVVESERLIGFFMIGQVNMPDVYGDIILERQAQWAKSGLDAEELRILLQQLPVMTHEKMLAAAHMLEVLAGYIYIKGLVRRQEPPLCEKLKLYISENLSEKLTLDGIASALNVSRSTLCHTVRRELDLSVVELIKRQRVEKAAQRLRDGVPLSVAAREAGFSSSGYCTRVFKQILGTSPSAITKKE